MQLNGRKIENYEWLSTLSIVTIHVIAYLVSTSQNDFAQVKVSELAGLLRKFVPGSHSYEMLSRPFEIPYTQLFCAFFTAQISFWSAKRGAIYDQKKSQEGKDYLLFLIITIGLFFLALVLLLIPPEGFSVKNLGTYYGVYAPLRYAIAASLLGYSARILVVAILQVLDKRHNFEKTRPRCVRKKY